MTLKRPRAVLFDLDGTLLDSLDDITIVLGRVLRAHQFPPPDRHAVATMVGDGARSLVARAVGLPRDDARVGSLTTEYLDAYAADPTPATRLMEGATALLDALAAAGIRSVVCTNKPKPVASVVVARTLGDRVLGVIGAGDAPKLKPARDPVDAALALAGVSGDDAWMVGDAEQDVLAAKAAGVASIAFTGGYGDPERLRAAGADVYVDRLDALVARL